MYTVPYNRCMYIVMMNHLPDMLLKTIQLQFFKSSVCMYWKSYRNTITTVIPVNKYTFLSNNKIIRLQNSLHC